VSLRAERSNPVPNKIKPFEIAASLTLLAMTARIEFFRKLLKQEKGLIIMIIPKVRLEIWKELYDAAIRLGV